MESISFVHIINKALLQGEILPPQTQQSRALSPAITSSPFSTACYPASYLPFSTSCSIDHQQQVWPAAPPSSHGHSSDTSPPSFEHRLAITLLAHHVLNI